MVTQMIGEERVFAFRPSALRIGRGLTVPRHLRSAHTMPDQRFVDKIKKILDSGLSFKDWVQEYRKRVPLTKLERQQNWNHDNPLRMKAHQAVLRAIRNGKLIRPDRCSNCDALCKPEGHHESYEKPLDVIWLCKECHKEV
jgi:hypothetical protein